VDPDNASSEEGANIDLDSQRQGKCAVIKTSTRQVSTNFQDFLQFTINILNNIFFLYFFQYFFSKNLKFKLITLHYYDIFKSN
jgi:hypothetical protein